MNIVFFDIDGVIVKECGVAEFGYGFVLYMLSDLNFNLEQKLKDLTIPQQYLDLAQQLRHTVKGKHPVEKIQILKDQLKSTNQMTNAEIVKYWYQAQRAYIQQYYPIEKYKIKEIDDVFQSIRKLDIIIVALTANEQEQAKWLLEYAQVLQFFDDVIGYDINASTLFKTKVELMENKTIQLKNYDR